MVVRHPQQQQQQQQQRRVDLSDGGGGGGGIVFQQSYVCRGKGIPYVVSAFSVPTCSIVTTRRHIARTSQGLWTSRRIMTRVLSTTGSTSCKTRRKNNVTEDPRSTVARATTSSVLMMTTDDTNDEKSKQGLSSPPSPLPPFDVPSLNDNPKPTIPRTGNDGDDPSTTTTAGRDILTHIRLVDNSLRLWTGKGVLERMGMTTVDAEDRRDDQNDDYEQIYLNDRYVLITHGTEDDPIYNFANRAALAAFWRPWDDVVQLPSSQSVVLRSVDESKRIELMKSVTENNYVEEATGIRVRDDGKFIQLVDAVVWNVVDDGDDDGNRTYIGQAAFFDRYQCPILESIIIEKENDE